MSETKKSLYDLKITDADFNAKSVSSLANRPNAPSRLGADNLTAEQLKAKFDANPMLLKDAFNGLIDMLIDGTFLSDVKVKLSDDDDTVKTLAGFLSAVVSGVLSEKYLKAKRNENAVPATLDTVLAGKVERIKDAFKVYVTNSLCDTVGVDLDNYSGSNGKIARRKSNNQLMVPLKPEGDDDAASKKYVDDNVISGVSAKYDANTRDLSFEFSRKSGDADKININIPLDSLKVAKVEDLEKEDGHYIKITFYDGSVIEEKLDVLFKGIDNLLKDKANKAEVEAELTKKATNESVNNRFTQLNESINASISALDSSTTEAINSTNIRVNDVNKRVANLEGMLIKYTEDSSEVYAKSVPTNSVHKAILNRVGGKTIQKGSKNICTDAVAGGIPFEIPLDGAYEYTFTVPAGTYSYYAVYSIESENTPSSGTRGSSVVVDGVNYFSVPCTVSSSNGALFTTMIENFKADYGTGTVKGHLFVTIVAGTEIPTEYEPYEAPSLEPTKVTEIVSKSANKIPFPYINGNVVKGHDYIKNVNGLTWRIDVIGRIKVNGTATANCYLTFLNGPRLPDGDYEVSGCPVGGGENSYSIRVVRNGSIIGRDDGNGGLTVIQGDYQISAYIYIRKGTSVTNAVFYPQLRRITRYPIPIEIQKKEGYGYSVDDVCDEINFDSKKYANRVAPLVLNGTEKWKWYNHSQYVTPFFALPVSDVDESIVNVKLICSHYEQDYNWYVSDDNGIWWLEDSGDYFLAIRDNRFTSDTEFKAHLDKLAANDTPVTVVYELPNPTETDLSTVLTDYPDYKFIEVQRGGELIAENKNKNKNPVPWTVTFAET